MVERAPPVEEGETEFRLPDAWRRALEHEHDTSTFSRLTKALTSPIWQSLARNPYPLYTALRRKPVFYAKPLGCWVVSSYAAVREAFMDHGVLSPLRTSAFVSAFVSRYSESQLEAAATLFELLHKAVGWDRRLDHDRLRALTQPFFLPKTLELQRERIRTIVEDLVDSYAISRRLEVHDYAEQIPEAALGLVLGVPPELQEGFRDDCLQIGEYINNPAHHGDEGLQRAHAAALRVIDCVRGVAAERRHHPGDDLISHLLEGLGQPESLHDEVEMASQAAFLLIAGHRATVFLITYAVQALLAHPEQKRRLLETPELIAGAIEESARHEAPILASARFPTRPFALEGASIPVGEPVLLLLGSANRDPRQFPNPGRFDITRSPNLHLSFGAGTFVCLGAALARLEAQEAVGALFRRWPNLDLARDAGRPHWTVDFTGQRTIERLTVAY